MPELNFRTASSIHEVDPSAWDRLSGGRAFQSHAWYAYGQRVMEDCPPLYLLAYEGQQLVGRAALWLVENEPMPKMLGKLRRPAMSLVRRWPLLICRSPLASTSGLILPEAERHAEVLAAFTGQALAAAAERGASFVVFDFLGGAEAAKWPVDYNVMSTFDPGMRLENRWGSLEEYLADGDKKDRQHYKRTLREAGKLGIRIERRAQPEGIAPALALIRQVESSHGALPNPWTGRMLEHMHMVGGSFLAASIDERLVGCGLLVEDNASQMTTALGLAEDVPYVYFMLVYESLKIAFERGARSLRWGSGATDVKERLGFSPEDNGSLSFAAVSPVLRKLFLWVARRR